MTKYVNNKNMNNIINTIVFDYVVIVGRDIYEERRYYITPLCTNYLYYCREAYDA